MQRRSTDGTLNFFKPNLVHPTVHTGIRTLSKRESRRWQLQLTCRAMPQWRWLLLGLWVLDLATSTSDTSSSTLAPQSNASVGATDANSPSPTTAAAAERAALRIEPLLDVGPNSPPRPLGRNYSNASQFCMISEVRTYRNVRRGRSYSIRRQARGVCRTRQCSPVVNHKS